MSDESKRVRLPVRRTRVVSAEEVREGAATVHCPIHGGAHLVARCAECPRLVDRSDAVVECVVPAAAAGAVTVSGAVAGAETTCLDSELPAARALEVLGEAGVTTAPVVDDHGVLVGMVTAAELVRAMRRRRGGVVEVEDAMHPQDRVSLPEHASLAEAAAMMDRLDVDRLPVVDAQGRLVGTLCALDLVRWFSRAAGGGAPA